MIITILNFEIIPQETGGFDLYENKKANKEHRLTKNEVTRVHHAYGITFERCLKKIPHIIASRNEKTVSLSHFLKGYEKLVKQIEDIAKQ